MKSRAQFGMSAALLLACSPLALAQHVSTGHRVSQPGPARMRPVAGASGGARVTSTRVTNNRTTTAAASGDGFFGAGLTAQELLNPFPGFGFNFEHLNAINSDLGVKAFIDPVTQLRLATAERVLRDSRFLGSPGVFLLDGGGAYVYPAGPAGPDTGDQGGGPAPAAAQPQVIVVQAGGAQAAQQSTGPEAQAEPIPDVGEFLLVLRNGVEISAVAFTRVNDRIVYITPAGGRRTIAAADLDSEATERTNQERGTPLQLSL
jgi:hypothetical protein